MEKVSRKDNGRKMRYMIERGEWNKSMQSGEGRVEENEGRKWKAGSGMTSKKGEEGK